MPPASLNLASTSLVLECSASPCFALLTVDPDPGILSCGSAAESRHTVETFCQESGKVIHESTQQHKQTKISCHQEVAKESGVPVPPPELRLAFEVSNTYDMLTDPTDIHLVFLGLCT